MPELAEGARLEIVCSANPGTVGSNPTLSAMHHIGCMASHGPMHNAWSAMDRTRFRVSPEGHVIQGQKI
jgi:hypothetical protein